MGATRHDPQITRADVVGLNFRLALQPFVKVAAREEDLGDPVWTQTSVAGMNNRRPPLLLGRSWPILVLA